MLLTILDTKEKHDAKNRNANLVFDTHAKSLSGGGIRQGVQ